MDGQGAGGRRVAVTFGEAAGGGGTARMHVSKGGVFFEFTRPAPQWVGMPNLERLAEGFSKDVARAVMEAGRESGAPLPSMRYVERGTAAVEVGAMDGKLTVMLRGTYPLHAQLPPPGKEADEKMAERLAKLGWKVIKG